MQPETDLEICAPLSEDGPLGELWQPLAMFLLGSVAAGALMMIRGDFLGRRAADDVESRLNTRIDREMAFIGRELKEIKEALVREGRMP